MSKESPSIRFDEFTLDRDRHELSCAGRVIPLRPKTLAVLVYLVENADRVVSKQELLRAVWPAVRIETQGVYQSVAELRAVFRGRKYIRTVRGTGYQWSAGTSPSPGQARRFRGIGHWLRYAIPRPATAIGAAVLVIAVLITSPVTHWIDDSRPTGDPEALVDRARAYHAEGRLDVAQEILSGALDQYPQHLGARLGLAQILHAKGNGDRALDMAKALYRDAIGMGAPHIRMESALLLSNLRHARDDRAMPRVYARETVQFATWLHNPVVAGAAHERLGDIYLEEGRRSLATLELQEAARNYRGFCPSSAERVDAKLKLISGRSLRSPPSFDATISAARHYEVTCPSSRNVD